MEVNNFLRVELLTNIKQQVLVIQPLSFFSHFNFSIKLHQVILWSSISQCQSLMIKSGHIIHNSVLVMLQVSISSLWVCIAPHQQLGTLCQIIITRSFQHLIRTTMVKEENLVLFNLEVHFGMTSVIFLLIPWGNLVVPVLIRELSGIPTQADKNLLIQFNS